MELNKDDVFDEEAIDGILDFVRSNVVQLKALNCSNCGHGMYVLIKDEGLGLTGEQIDRLWKKGIWVI